MSGSACCEGTRGAVAFHVGPGAGHAQVALLHVGAVGADAFAVLAVAAARRQALGDDVQRVQQVGADVLDEGDGAAAGTRAGHDQLVALEQVVGVARRQEVAAHGLAGFRIGDHGQVAVARVVRHAVIERGRLDRQLQHRVRGHILHPAAPQVHFAPVAQRIVVSLDAPQHGSLLTATEARIVPWANESRRQSAARRTDQKKMRSAESIIPHSAFRNPHWSGDFVVYDLQLLRVEVDLLTGQKRLERH